MVSDGALLGVPVLLPLLGAAAAFLLSRHAAVQRIVTAVVLAAVVGAAAVLLWRADTQGPTAVQAGGWAPPVGITLVADRLAALALAVSVAVFLVVFAYAAGQGVADRRPENVPSVFYPAYLGLAAGVGLAFLSGDLFTLFVGFEVTLMSSYVLLTAGATLERVRAGMTYVVVSLVASILLLTCVGLVYAVTGTLNLAQLGSAFAAVPPGVRTALSLLLLVALGTKAAVVPLHLWLPDSYPSASAPVTAIFAALLTKVGVYALVRTQTLLFPRDEPWDLLAVLAAATMLVGILGALAQDDLDRLLSFTLVSHIGFLLMGLALSTAAGLAGTVLYLVHHITVQAALFLVVGLVERERGTRSLAALGGIAATAPLLAVLFLPPALSLSGIPPLAGFLGKLALLQAALAEAGWAGYGLATAALLASLLTLAAMAKVWALAFWGEPAPPRPDPDPDDEVVIGTGAPARLMTGAASAVVLVGLGVAALAGPLSGVAVRAAADLEARTPYQQAVLGDLP